MSHILEFLDLVDVPTVYDGYPGAYVKVNAIPAGVGALEFVVDDTFHAGTANEITAVTAKTTLVDADEFLLEDSGASFVKKAVTAANLKTYVGASGGDDDAIHDNVANEITAITPKTTLLDADEFILEDSGASYVKKAVTASNIGAYVESDLGGPWLRLTAGSGAPLTGDLYVDTATNAAIYLREAAASNDYTRLQDAGTTSTWLKAAATGGAVCSIRPTPADNTNLAAVDIFRTTETSGSRNFTIYEGSAGDATIAHQFNAGTGDVNLCQQGGSLTVEEGNLYIDKTSDPSIFLRTNAATNDYLRVWEDSANSGKIQQWSVTGTTYMDVDAIPSDGTSHGYIRMFRTCNTTGTATALLIYKGDGSSTVQHSFLAKDDVDLCKTAGDLTVGSSGAASHIYIDSSSTPTLYMREGASATDYSTIKDGGTALQLAKFSITGDSIITFSPVCSDGSSDAYIRFFRNTNTSGTKVLEIHEGTGSDSIQHSFEGDTGIINLCNEELTTSYIDIHNAGVRLNNNYGLIAAQEVGGTYRNILRMNTSDVCVLGNANNEILINGSATRPQYNSVDLALYSDLAAPTPPVRVDLDNHANMRRYINIYSGYVGSGAQTGAIVIKPWGAATPAATMLNFNMHGYTWKSTGSSISGAWGVSFGGYAAPAWSGIGISAEVLYGAPPFDTIRLSTDASGYPAIVIGLTTTIWDYCVFSIDAISGWSGADNWDPDDVTYALDASLTSFTFTRTAYLVPGEYIQVTNVTGVTIDAQQLCYISGHSSEVPRITLADADAENTSKGLLVYTRHAIAHNGFGQALMRGAIITTSITAGAVYYLSTTAGGRTTVAPTGSGDVVRIVGYGMGSTRFWFDPDKTWVTRI